MTRLTPTDIIIAAKLALQSYYLFNLIEMTY